MAVTTNAGLCDYALAKIAHKPVDFDPTTGTADQDAERRLLELYEPTRDFLLSSHPWNFAIRRINFDVDNIIYDISGATQADPVVLTVTAHPYSVGDTVYVWNVSGMTDINITIFVVGAAATNTISLYKQDRVTTVDGSAYSAYTSGGYVRLCPLSVYGYMYALPSECLTFWDIISTPAALWTQEQGHLLCDLDDLEGVYIQQVTDVAKFHPLFIECFALRLAYELASSLETTIKKADLLLEFDIILRRAYMRNAMAKKIKSKGHKVAPSEDIGWQKGAATYY